MFVSANAIEDSKVVPTLLTVVGSKPYSLLCGLVSLEIPKGKTYNELVDLLKKRFDPEPIVIAERFHFYQRNQKPGESIADYLAALRRLASRCKFGAFLTEALRDKLVCGMHSESIVKVLLTKANLTLDKAMEISQAMEAASTQSKELTSTRGSQKTSPAVLNVATPAAKTLCGQRFTTLDLSHAYNQLLLDEDSRKYVTINSHKDFYQYTRLPFGIASAPAVFQRTMDTILQGVDATACYIDDIIVTGKSPEEHLAHLEEALKRFLWHGIHVKKSKCSFLKPSVVFLGHRIDAEGLHPTKEKLKAIVEAPVQKNVQELRSFLGLINYYRKFIPNASTILAPLNALLRNDAKWTWNQKCQESFDQAKSTLVSSDVLVHYNADLPIRIADDASAYGVGAVLAHVLPNGSERPVAFALHTLTSSEKNYAQVEKEALS